MKTTNLFILAIVAVSCALSKNVRKKSSKSSVTSTTTTWITEPVASINDSTVNSRRLVEYTKREFGEKKVHHVVDNIYIAIGYALGNSMMIIGTDGLIIIDVTESADAMVEIMEEFHDYAPNLPVKAILFTHFHSDHITGCDKVVELEKEKFGDNIQIDIYAHETTEAEMNAFADTYDIGVRRANRMFGNYIPFNPVNNTGSGLGPFLRLDNETVMIIPVPTVTYSDRQEYTVAGITFELIHVPGETDDQTALWYPEKRALFIGDDVYKTFPNLYTIRGSPARDAKVWYESLDKIMPLRAEYLIGSHCTWFQGENEIYENLVLYRDAIKFVHDQTLRYTNKGYFPNEITELVVLPEAMKNSLFLQEHYGFVPWCVRGIFTNYLGWFSGDPKDLNPMSESARAANMIDLVNHAAKQGGDSKTLMLEHAQISHLNSDQNYRTTGSHLLNEDKWALELVDLLLADGGLSGEMEDAATIIKTSALTAIGVEESSPNGRNYYLTYASEVYNGIDIDRTPEVRATELKSSPIERVLGIQCSKVDGLACEGDDYSILLTFTDENKDFIMRLRNCVCDVLTNVPSNPNPDVQISTDAVTYKAIAAEDLDLAEEEAAGNVEILVGTLEEYQEFLGCFDSLLDL